MTQSHLLPPVHRRSCAVFLLALGLSALGLACGNSKKNDVAPSSTAPALASSAPQAPEAPARPPRVSPVGPELYIIPGVGISAIRFGSNFDSLARHMAAPCDIRTETRCLYIAQAVDFTMKDGVVDGMKVYRLGRAVPGVPGETFGTFKGYMAPSIQFGLHRHIVAEEIHMKPTSVENITGDPQGLVAREVFDGVTIEYDLLANGNVIAAAFEITRAAAKTGATPQKPSAPLAQPAPQKAAP